MNDTRCSIRCVLKFHSTTPNVGLEVLREADAETAYITRTRSAVNARLLGIGHWLVLVYRPRSLC